MIEVVKPLKLERYEVAKVVKGQVWRGAGGPRVYLRVFFIFFQLSMLRLAIRRAATSRTCVPLAYKRCMATVIPEQPVFDSAPPTAKIESSGSTMVQNQALRPHLNIPVKEDHGLYNFFRKIPDEDSVKGYKYVTYEHMNERDHGLSECL
jgi:hypothetical protein